MPFSSLLEIQFKELIDNEINKVTFTTLAEFDVFCASARQFLSSEQLSADAAFHEDLLSLDEILHGFDIYATDEIVNVVNRVQFSRASGAGYTNIPAFTSVSPEKKCCMDHREQLFQPLELSDVQRLTTGECVD